MESLKEAAKLLDRAIAIDPNYAPAYAQRGITFILLRESAYGTIPRSEALERAKVMFDQALSLDPRCADALAGLGLYFKHSGNAEKSKEVLQKALAISPNMVDAIGWLAATSGILGDFAEERRLRMEVVARDPLNLPGLTHAVDQFLLSGEQEKAQALLSQARPFMPTSTIIFELDGWLFWNAGRFADSLSKLEKAYEMQPNNYLVALNLASAYLDTWQYERAAEIGSGPHKVFALMHLGRKDEATKLAWELVDSEIPNFALTIVDLLAREGLYAELIGFIESRWTDPDAFEADYLWNISELGHIAYSYQRLGNMEKFNEALSRLKAALDYRREVGFDNSNLTYLEAVHAVLAGDDETALNSLAKSIEGFFVSDSPQLSEESPMFESLEGDPRYEAIQNRMVEHVNSERVKLGLEPVTLVK